MVCTEDPDNASDSDWKVVVLEEGPACPLSSLSDFHWISGEVL